MTDVSQDNRAAFGAKLKQFREEVALSQKELAALVGLTAPAIARIEAGASAPSWDTAVRLAAALDRSLDEFLGVEPQPPDGK